MKAPAIVFLLILVHTCSVRSASLNFETFFQKHNNDQSRFLQSAPQPRFANLNNNQQPPPPVSPNEQIPNVPDPNSSESYSEYRSESDPYLYNASSEQDRLDESSNSSTNESDLSEQMDEKLNNSTEQHSISDSTSTESHSNASSSDSSTESHSNASSSDSSSESHSNASSSDSSSESHSNASSSESSGAGVSSTPVSSTTLIVTSAVSNATSGKEVVLATAETTAEEVQKSIFQKSLDWVKDDYVLSILVPVAAGVLFAVTVICTLAMCRCCRRCCRRRRFRKKCLPDSVRNLSTSDRKRLLGDMSSDDEF